MINSTAVQLGLQQPRSPAQSGPPGQLSCNGIAWVPVSGGHFLPRSLRGVICLAVALSFVGSAGAAVANLSTHSDAVDEYPATFTIDRMTSVAPASTLGESAVAADSGSAFLTNWTVVKDVDVGSGSDDVAFASPSGKVFVPNGQGNNVTVISDTTDHVVANVAVGDNPDSVAYDNRTGQVFVTNYGSNNVSVINASTDKVVATVTTQSSPDAVVYDWGTHQIFVANYNSASVSVISDSSDSVVATIPVAANPTSDPAGLAYDHARGEIWASVQFGHNASVISDSTDTVLRYLPVGPDPKGVVFDPTTSEVFVGNYGSNNLTVLSDVSDRMVANITTGDEPTTGDIDVAAGELFFPDVFSGYVGVISAQSNSQIEIVHVPGAYGAAFDPVTDQVFVAGGPSGDVAILGLATESAFPKVTFSETGLPSGTEWWVNLTNGQGFDSTSKSITFNEPNGSYEYTIGVANKSFKSKGAEITVDGAALSVKVKFSLQEYDVTFTESGLPTGSKWWVNVTGGRSYNSTKATLSFKEPNGSYSYLTSTNAKGYDGPGGNFVVDGAKVSVKVKFSYGDGSLRDLSPVMTSAAARW